MERNCYVFKIEDITFTIYDNPPRAITEWDSSSDGHIYTLFDEDPLVEEGVELLAQEP